MGTDLKGKDLGKGITQRKDGRYVGRMRYKGNNVLLYSYNYQSLKKELNEEKIRIDSGLEKLKEYTFKEWFDEWFDTYKAPNVRPQSVAPMKRKVLSTFMPYLEDKKLNEIKSIQVQQAINELIAEEKYARTSIAEALNRVSECFASAQNNGYCTVNPCFDLKVPFKTDNHECLNRWLTLDEIDEFLDAAKDNWWYEMLYTAIYTGMRIGEIGGLKTENIHWSTPEQNGYIELKQAFICDYKTGTGTKKCKLGPLKTPNSYRKIPFIKDVEKCLKSQIKKRDLLKERLGDRYRAKDEFEDLVFVTQYGSPCSRYNAEKTCNIIVNAVNIIREMEAKRKKKKVVLMEHIYPHALRHTFCSLCYQAGVDVKVTQALLGHRSLSTTMDIYTHLSAEKVDFNIKKLEELKLRNFVS